jgi:hypothetical protein
LHSERGVHRNPDSQKRRGTLIHNSPDTSFAADHLEAVSPLVASIPFITSS